MSRVLEDLRRRMAAAVEALDFEEASRIRDKISLLRSRQSVATDQEIDTSRLRRQAPGEMGLGTSDQTMTPPPGWAPPKRPDPMTTARRQAKRGKG
jgi:hypothetical protein